MKNQLFWLTFPVLKPFIKIFEARNEQATALLETVSALRSMLQNNIVFYIMLHFFFLNFPNFINKIAIFQYAMDTVLLLNSLHRETNVSFIASVLIGDPLVCDDFYLSTFISKQYFSLKT